MASKRRLFRKTPQQKRGKPIGKQTKISRGLFQRFRGTGLNLGRSRKHFHQNKKEVTSQKLFLVALTLQHSHTASVLFVHPSFPCQIQSPTQVNVFDARFIVTRTNPTNLFDLWGLCVFFEYILFCSVHIPVFPGCQVQFTYPTLLLFLYSAEIQKITNKVDAVRRLDRFQSE